MIIVTGAAGFIGYNMIKKLNDNNFNHIIAVDTFIEYKHQLEDCKILKKIDRKDLCDWLDNNYEHVEFIIHLGARTDTAELDTALLKKLNTEYSKTLWNKCIDYQIPFIYASSAATYGLGENGYEDNEKTIHLLKPLNAYGESKQIFDLWVLEQKKQPFYWCGLKFFNVYGPGEKHKERMASVAWHAYQQILTTGTMKLFRSHHPQFKDGEQQRDFIYVEDIVNVIYWLMHHRKNVGIYNLGSGKARTFLALIQAVFAAMKKEEKITFIDTPIDIRDKYQYFTEANMNKLKSIGYDQSFLDVEEGVTKYIDYLNLYKNIV